MNQHKEGEASRQQQAKVAATFAAKSSNIILISALCLIMSTMLMANTAAAGMSLTDQYEQSAGKQPSVTLAVIEQPEVVARVLENLLRSILYSASIDVQLPNTNGAQKRGLDLGISRGYSGSQAGKHLMGLSAASFANGPGKR